MEKKPVYVLLGVILVGLIIVVIVYFAINNNSNTENSNTEKDGTATQTSPSSLQNSKNLEGAAIVETQTPPSSFQKTENSEGTQKVGPIHIDKPAAARAPAVPVFDCEYYVMSNPELRDLFFRSQDHKLNCDKAFQHWLQHGRITHSDKNIPPPDFYADFDCLEYLHRYPNQLKPYFLMNDRTHFDCMHLKMWYDYVGKYQNNIATYVP